MIKYGSYLRYLRRQRQIASKPVEYRNRPKVVAEMVRLELKVREFLRDHPDLKNSRTALKDNL